jgi:hypothetical protein
MRSTGNWALTALAVDRLSSKSERGTRGSREGVMAGLVPAIHVFNELNDARKSDAGKALFLRALRPEETTSHSSWSRRGVDGRDNPRIKFGDGHDEGSVQRAPSNELPTIIAIRAQHKKALIAITVDGLPPPSWPALCRPSTPSGSAVDSLVRIMIYLQSFKLDVTVFSWMAGSSQVKPGHDDLR